jgi:hypothetical protein
MSFLDNRLDAGRVHRRRHYRRRMADFASSFPRDGGDRELKMFPPSPPRAIGTAASVWRAAASYWRGDSLSSYRQNIIQNYTALADQRGLSHGAAKWFSDHRGEIEKPVSRSKSTFGSGRRVAPNCKHRPCCLVACGTRWGLLNAIRSSRDAEPRLPIKTPSSFGGPRLENGEPTVS